MKRTFAGAGVIASIALLAGCSSDEEFTPRSGTQTYESATAIADDMAAGGIPCDSVNVTTAGSKYASDTRYCAIGPQGGFMLSVHNSQADIDDLSVAVQNSLSDEYGLLTGANWSVNCQTPNKCAELKGVLGGKIISSANL